MSSARNMETCVQKAVLALGGYVHRQNAIPAALSFSSSNEGGAMNVANGSPPPPPHNPPDNHSSSPSHHSPMILKLKDVIPFVNAVLTDSLGHELIDIYDFLNKVLLHVFEIKRQVESIRNINFGSDKNLSTKLQSIFELVDSIFDYIYNALMSNGNSNSCIGEEGGGGINAMNGFALPKIVAIVDREMLDEMRSILKSKLVVFDSSLASKIFINNPKNASKKLSSFVFNSREVSAKLAGLLELQVVNSKNIRILDFIQQIKQLVHSRCQDLIKCFSNLPDVSSLSKELISKYNIAERLFQRYKACTQVVESQSEGSKHNNVLYSVIKLKEEIAGIEEIASSRLEPVIALLRNLTEFNVNTKMFVLKSQYQPSTELPPPADINNNNSISVNPWIERIANLILVMSSTRDILLNCSRNFEKEFITSWAMLQAILRQTNYMNNLSLTSPKSYATTSSPKIAPPKVPPHAFLTASDEAEIEGFDSEFFTALSRDWYSRILKLDSVYRSSDFQGQYSSLQNSRNLFQDSLQTLKIAIINFLGGLKQYQDCKFEMTSIYKELKKGISLVGFANVLLDESIISTESYDLDVAILKKIEKLLESPLCCAVIASVNLNAIASTPNSSSNSSISNSSNSNKAS